LTLPFSTTPSSLALLRLIFSPRSFGNAFNLLKHPG
jgi:hypothetical protein